AEYGAAVAQRNAALRRSAAGFAGLDAVEPWSEQVAALGAELVSARLEVLGQLEPSFVARAASRRRRARGGRTGSAQLWLPGRTAPRTSGAPARRGRDDR